MYEDLTQDQIEKLLYWGERFKGMAEYDVDENRYKWTGITDEQRDAQKLESFNRIYDTIFPDAPDGRESTVAEWLDHRFSGGLHHYSYVLNVLSPRLPLDEEDRWWNYEYKRMADAVIEAVLRLDDPPENWIPPYDRVLSEARFIRGLLDSSSLVSVPDDMEGEQHPGPKYTSAYYFIDTEGNCVPAPDYTVYTRHWYDGIQNGEYDDNRAAKESFFATEFSLPQTDTHVAVEVARLKQGEDGDHYNDYEVVGHFIQILGETPCDGG